MKTKKLLERLADLLSSKGQKRRVELASLRTLLRKLEKKEEKVLQKLAAAKKLGDEGADLRKRLSDKLRVLRAQRSKGVRRCSELAD